MGIKYPMPLAAIFRSTPLMCQACQVKCSPASSALQISGIHMVTPPRTFTSCSSSFRAAMALSRATGWLVHQP